jgi:hypothetical protein
MRNIILAGTTGLVLALTGASAYAIPRTSEILSHSQMTTQDQGAVGAFLPFSSQPDNANAYPPAIAHTFGGQGGDTGQGPGGTNGNR